MQNRSKERPHAGDYSATVAGANIEPQLDRILESDAFAKLRRLREILRFVVQETLAGRQNSIKASTVGVHVFGRDPLVNPDDPIVRISVGRLRRALDDYYANEGAEDPVRISIPKGTYVPEFSRLSRKRRRRTARRPRVAVLPFKNRGEDNDSDYFIDALGEEISVQLARFADLAVLAYWTTCQTTHEERDILKIAKELNADFVVSGSAARNASRVRVNVECIDIESAEQIWARNFDRDLTLVDLFDVQDEIVSSVAARIGDEYGSISRKLFLSSRNKPVRDLSAYEAVLAGHHYARHLDDENHRYARRALERAVEVEPSYALAWALLGDMYGDMHAFELGGLTAPLAHAERCVTHALSADPRCQHAHWTSAFLGVLTKDRARVISHVDNVVRLNPNSAFLTGASAVWLGVIGNFERAFALLETSEELNPRYPGWFHFLPWLHAFSNRDYEAANTAARNFNTPLNIWDPIMRASSLGKLGRAPEAAEAYAELIAVRTNFVERHDHFLSCLVHDDDVRADVVDGLRVAGLPRN